MATEVEVLDGVNSFNTFIHLHGEQLSSSGIPSYFWETLFYKLQNEVVDAGDFFEIERLERTDECGSNSNQTSFSHSWKVVVIDEQGIDVGNPQHIYIIDHAWTFRMESARTHLETMPNLLQRMTDLMEIDVETLRKEDVIDNVLTEIWRYIQTYSIRGLHDNVETTLPVWYVMDEFGSRIQHSDEPTFRTVPFYHIFTQVSYTLLFPVKNVQFRGEVTRNFIEGPPVDEDTMRALKIPWFNSCMTDIDFTISEPEEEHFMSYREEETLPSPEAETLSLPKNRKLKVYSEYEAINLHLTHPAFEIVYDEDSADILWYMNHFKDFRRLSENSPSKAINQFPNENILTIKDLLSYVCRRIAISKHRVVIDPQTLEAHPNWFPATFNLKTELPHLVSYFQHRQQRELDNHWMCKPWNMARGLDIHITNNLNCITRLPATGPKIACKYVEDPVLFHRPEISDGPVKFDIRYILLLKSVDPLSVYIYRRFWLRFANKAFSLDHLDDYEKHFTVMNYRNTNLRQMFCQDFIQEFERQYPNIKYGDIEEEIFEMFKSVFQAATSVPPPRGIGQSSQSRAVYGADVMLRWSEDHERVHPVLLEINWSPDCKRACDYYPEFYNDIFSVLFLDDDIEKHVKLL